MRVSYVQRDSKNGHASFIGPLEKYSNYITRLDVMRRRAMVEAKVFGKMRKFKFGLWTCQDPPIYWIEEKIKEHEKENGKEKKTDIEIRPGDKVEDVTGIWRGQVFNVLEVDAAKRMIVSNYEMMGTTARVMLSVDGVRVV